MRFYEAVTEALSDCKTSLDPIKTLVEIIEENIRADENEFSLELLAAFIKTKGSNHGPGPDEAARP